MNDVIAGKSTGITLLTEGPPGVGKTLTAEVTAEKLEKALYSVQCSQLGTEEEKIENTLKLVMDRAARWGALLMIDEADTYIRERREDIQQNYIVGIFLRVTEYYKGVLFMATNLGTVVDDAIISRCTAVISYNLSDAEARERIFRIQSELLGVPLGDVTSGMKGLVKLSEGFSGRDIRSLLKLAKLISESEGCRIDEELLTFCKKYQKISE